MLSVGDVCWYQMLSQEHFQRFCSIHSSWGSAVFAAHVKATHIIMFLAPVCIMSHMACFFFLALTKKGSIAGIGVLKHYKWTSKAVYNYEVLIKPAADTK